MNRYDSQGRDNHLADLVSAFESGILTPGDAMRVLKQLRPEWFPDECVREGSSLNAGRRDDGTDSDALVKHLRQTLRQRDRHWTEVERQRAAMRSALEKIAEMTKPGELSFRQEAYDLARRALDRT